MKEFKVKLTFTRPILGTMPNDKEVCSRFIASNAPNAATREEEIEAIGVDAFEERGMTVFPRTADGVPFLYDYQVKGFFKDACSMLRKVPGTHSSKIKAFKKQIDGLIFVNERQIPFDIVGEIGDCQRPLRAQTAQGERVALANSESISEGSSVTFTIKCFVDSDVPMVMEWLEYGAVRGIGQWRNSGKGCFEVEYLD